MSMITVKPVTTAREFKKFTKFKLDLYRGNPYFVPPLYADEREVLMKGRNPAHKLHEHEVFVAERDGKIVGRIAAIINRAANRKEGTDFVRFGFIDFIDDDEVVEALIGTVEEWGRARGMTAMHGPLGFTDFDPEGMLTWGFEELSTAITIPPTIVPKTVPMPPDTAAPPINTDAIASISQPVPSEGPAAVERPTNIIPAKDANMDIFRNVRK